MADEAATTTTTDTDVFQQQEKTIKLLYDVLQNQLNQTQQPVYVSAAQPAQTETPKATPNYLIWIAVAMVGFLLMEKTKMKLFG